MHTTTNHTTRRRLPHLLTTALLALLAAGIAAPGTAEAGVAASYTGWGTVDQPMRCMAVLPQCTDPYYDAWRWTGTSWTSTTLRHGTRAWIQPYAGQWHWIWTQQTGWLAISDSFVMYRS